MRNHVQLAVLVLLFLLPPPLLSLVPVRIGIMSRPRSNTHLTSLLAPFSSVDRRLPDNARVDHQIEQREVNGELTISGIASFLVDGGV